MMRSGGVLFPLMALAITFSAATQAQTIPGFGSGSSSSGSVSGLSDQLSTGASGLVEQALPNVSSASTANTTGVLTYCVENNYLKNNSATSVLSNLTGRSDMQSSSGFLSGRQGNLETGNGSMFSLSSLKDKAKSKLCDMVLQHAQSLL